MHHDARQATQAPADQKLALISCIAWLITPLQYTLDFKTTGSACLAVLQNSFAVQRNLS